jgi:glyoxylase-like metal-dependent hydrolase (beta-lactamase superfamily II)
MKAVLHSQTFSQLTQRFPIPINCYFVREEDGLTLIDTGFYRDAKPFLKAAKEHGADIRRIVLTHADSDHIATLDKLHEALPDAEIVIGVGEAERLSKTKASKLLREGDEVGSLEVIDVPGHSQGQIALFDKRDRTLIGGDAFQTQGGIAVAGVVRPLFPLPAWFTKDKALAVQSAKKLLAFNPSRLAVGHGKVLEQPLAAMTKAIAEAERSLSSASVTPSKKSNTSFERQIL